MPGVAQSDARCAERMLFVVSVTQWQNSLLWLSMIRLGCLAIRIADGGEKRSAGLIML